MSIEQLKKSSEQIKMESASILGVSPSNTEMVLLEYEEGAIKIKESKNFQEPFRFNLYSLRQRLPGLNAFIRPAFILLFILNALMIYKFAMAIVTLDLSLTRYRGFFYEGLIMLAPIILWAVSTNFMEFNFRNAKIARFIASYTILNIGILRFIYIVSYTVFIPLVVLIKPKGDMTIEKIEGLGYIATLLPTALVLTGLVYLSVTRTVLNDDFIKKLSDFRLFKVFDLSHYSKNEYVYQVVKDVKTGDKITIPQKDRQMHTAIIGATGTAKTSSVLLPGIINDLKVRAHNKSMLKKLFYKYSKEGLFLKVKSFEDNDFKTDFFIPNPEYSLSFKDKLTGRTPKRVYDYLIEKYEIAGQTILAPEDSLTDDAANLFDLFFEDYNRVDPKKIDGKHKKNFKGLNIFYISPDFPSWALEREKVRRATLLSDVMQMMFEMDGKSDPYFASVNRIATTTVSLLLQLTFPDLKNRPPHLLDVMDALNDHKLLIEPYNHLFPNNKITDRNKKYRWLKDNLVNYFFGEGAATFEQHSRGLKIQISSFLADDYIRELLTAKEVIDFDKMLSENQLTVVNIELPELGPVNAPALGLFFTVNMANAVLRRPGTERTRSFHVWRIDEFPIIVTPSMEQAFTLFRKFKVAMEVAMQTLDQMDKTPYLKYLKSVILNSTANQIVFGRANVSEMDTYSVLAGTMDDYIKMNGVSMSPLASDTQSVSIQQRETKSAVNVLEGGDIRNKDFQEVTYFYTKRGSLMPPVHGKVDFITKKEKKVKKHKTFDFSVFPVVVKEATREKFTDEKSVTLMKNQIFDNADKHVNETLIDPVSQEAIELTSMIIASNSEPKREERKEQEGNIIQSTEQFGIFDAKDVKATEIIPEEKPSTYNSKSKAADKVANSLESFEIDLNKDQNQNNAPMDLTLSEMNLGNKNNGKGNEKFH